MSRTVTGSYVLRPTSQRTYRSSGTFSDWFYNSSAPSSWTTNMNPGTKIGDNSDSTYYSDTGVSSSNSYAENAIMNLTVSSGTVPDVDYTIEQVTLTYRAKASTTTDGTRKLNIWNTIWYCNGNHTYTPKACMDAGNYGWKSGVFSASGNATASTSITNRSTSDYSGGSMPGGAYPDMHAICVQAYKTSAWVSFSSWQLYDIWFTVEWSYEEPDVKTYLYTDEGTSISGAASVPAGSTTIGETFIEASSGETRTLVASTLPGYVFDGWYLNGVKVSSNQTYQLTIAANASLYAISKVRKIYVGTLQVQAVFVGTTECEVYDGSEKVFGESNEYANATAVG